MNENIEAMLEELKEKYPDNWEDPIRGLYRRSWRCNV